MTIRSFSNSLLTSAAFLALVAGCSMQVSDRDKQGERKVEIQTPLGDMKVDTHDVNAQDTGLPVYPGARPVEKESPGDESKAHVNMNTPWFGLKVVALSYETDDPKEKVWAFYKKEMARYGKVLECKPGSPDEETRSKDGGELGCIDEGKRGNKNIDINPTEETLKVGVNEKQRIVAFKPRGNGTKFALVYIVMRTAKDTV